MADKRNAGVEQMELTMSSLSELPAVVQKIMAFVGKRRVFAFYADMGAGKTTIIKAICRNLGVEDNLSSPTFSVVNEYSLGGKPDRVYHIDLYRINDTEELKGIGLEEYVNGENYCFLEWAELAEDFLPPDAVPINIEVRDNIRVIRIFMN